MKINHEFNYCNLDHLIICRIDDVWLLNLFFFEITICFRFSCHDDVNDSNHYSESFNLDEDFVDTLRSLIVTIKKRVVLECKHSQKLELISSLMKSHSIFLFLLRSYKFPHVCQDIEWFTTTEIDRVIEIPTDIIWNKILSFTIFTSRARLGPVKLRALMRYATRVEDTDMFMMTSTFL